MKTVGFSINFDNLIKLIRLNLDIYSDSYDDVTDVLRPSPDERYYSLDYIRQRASQHDIQDMPHYCCATLGSASL